MNLKAQLIMKSDHDGFGRMEIDDREERRSMKTFKEISLAIGTEATNKSQTCPSHQPQNLQYFG